MQGTFSEEPGIVLAGALPFLVELLNVLCNVSVLNTFSKSSRTEKQCQFPARQVLALPGSISVFCNSRGRRIQILPVAFQLNIHDKIQKRVSKWHVTWQLIFFCLILFLYLQWPQWVMCFFSCSHIFIPCRLTCSRDGTRRASKVKFKQDVREWILFRDKGGMPSSQEGFMIFGFVFLFRFSLVFRLSKI